MPANKENVQRLVAAAWVGMEASLADTPGSAEEVINATIAIAAGGIRYACSAATGNTPEEIAQNRRAIRDTLQRLLLDTADDTKVM